MMGSSPLDLYAREYFTSLNSIAEKISSDISNAVAAYEDLWHTLNIKDQHQIINETIIHPDVVVKYSLSQPNGYNDLQKETYRYFAEEGKVGSWPDEHAAPFSWKTRSQQDLSVFVDTSVNLSQLTQSTASAKSGVKGNYSDISFEPPNVVLGGSSSRIVSGQQGILSKSENSNVSSRNNKSKSVILRIQTTALPPKKLDNRHNVHSMGESDNLVKHNGQCKVSRSQSKSIPKPKTPPPPPPPKLKLQNQVSSSCRDKDGKKESLIVPASKTTGTTTQESSAYLDALDDFNVNINTPVMCDSLPKTGFDFLDNW